MLYNKAIILLERLVLEGFRFELIHLLLKDYDSITKILIKLGHKNTAMNFYDKIISTLQKSCQECSSKELVVFYEKVRVASDKVIS